MVKNIAHLTTTRPQIEAVRTIPAALAKKHQVLPIKVVEQTLYLGMSDLTDVVAVDEIKLATGYDICPIVVDLDQLTAEIAYYYGPLDVIASSTDNNGRAHMAFPLLTVGDTSKLSTTDIVNSLFDQAIQQRASDIHLEPTTDGGRVRFRIDGIIHVQANFDPQTFVAVITSLKVTAGMDIAQRLAPQDGRMEINVSNQHFDVRLASLPTIKGEKLVMRLLNRATHVTDIESLGLSPQVQNRLHHFLLESGGMLLVTGPTGCGKTTTLYAVLQLLNNTQQNIITIEDPVEYHIPGINQVQVNPKAGLTFAGGLRAILRQDPNIIMVGEIRDLETAEIAIRSALTGHLVLSTLHTKDAASAITRLLDMGIEPFLLASAINGVISQRLVRSVCPSCGQLYSPDNKEKMLLEQHDLVNAKFTAGQGCLLCHYTGYQGRIPIAETLTVTTEIQRLIYDRCVDEEIRRQAIREGMVPLFVDGLAKAAAGQTTIAEVIRAVG